jgi:hypothetical protein
MRTLLAIAVVWFIVAVSENDGAAQEPKKREPPAVRVLQGWSLDKLGGDEEMCRSREAIYAFYFGVHFGWPRVGAVYKSLDEVAKIYPDKEFLRKLDKEVDFSKNVLLRYAWDAGGNPFSYQVLGTRERPVLVFSQNLRRTLERFNPGSVELIIPADVYKRSVERDTSQDRSPP